MTSREIFRSLHPFYGWKIPSINKGFKLQTFGQEELSKILLANDFETYLKIRKAKGTLESFNQLIQTTLNQKVFNLSLREIQEYGLFHQRKDIIDLLVDEFKRVKPGEVKKLSTSSFLFTFTIFTVEALDKYSYRILVDKDDWDGPYRFQIIEIQKTLQDHLRSLGMLLSNIEDESFIFHNNGKFLICSDELNLKSFNLEWDYDKDLNYIHWALWT